MSKSQRLKGGKKQGKTNDMESNKLPVLWRIVIVVYIVVLMYFLFKCGGNGADWYPGKPIYTR